MSKQQPFPFQNEPGRKRIQPLQPHCADAAKKAPKLSIVTPFYNSGAHLEQTYNCVMNQTFSDFEWIIVDDGSTRQEDCKLLQDLAATDDRIRLLTQANGGQSKAKNYGIRVSRAEIIVFLDADDLIEDFYLELLYEALKEHPDAAWSYTDLVGFGAWEYLWVKPFCAGRMTFNNTLVNAAAFRRSALLAVDGFTEVYKHYDEDWALYLKLLGAGCHPVHVPVIGFWYRRSDTGMQQTVRKDDALRRESDAYMAQLAADVDITIRGEEYRGPLPQDAYRTGYSGKERILTKLMSHPMGLRLIKNCYKKRG
jgi:glycosyltransferase involved in cell wall biosynthesis